jgi:hypothetical protein
MHGKPPGGRTMTRLASDPIGKLEQRPTPVCRNVVRVTIEADIGAYRVCETQIVSDLNSSILEQHGICPVMSVNSMRVGLL